ncbi:MAG: hypothetical protein PHI97_28035 [Desulfobulbus sp.]|nr:hypothetical protein [Desulfobulbus sp.]
MEYIKWKEYPTEHANRAYEEGFYLEAIQVLHGFLEAKMRDFLMVSRHGNLKRGYGEIWDMTQEMGFHQLARTLFVTGKLSESEHAKLQRFNSTRNRVVHKFFWEPYDKDYKGVPKNEFDEIFQTGLSLVEEMDGKAATVLWRRQKRQKQTSTDNVATGAQSETEE